MYVNPPESYMFLPNFLGGPNGGYHYLKLNGKWLDTNSVVTPVDFTLCGANIRWQCPIVDSITGFVQIIFCKLSNS
jgi:hypothetical protein